MSCWRTKRRLFEYLEGRLPVKSAEEVDFHLATCAACRDTATRLGQSRAILRTLGREPAPDDLKSAIWERVATRQGHGLARQAWQVRGLALGYRRWPLVGMALVMAVLVPLGLRWVSRPPGGAQEGLPTGSQTARMVGEGNEMDQFVDFAVKQHSQFVSQRALGDEGMLGVVRQVRPWAGRRAMRSLVRPRRPFEASSNGGAKGVAGMPGQTAQWWWTEGGGR